MAYPLFGSPEPPHNSRLQNGPGFSANAVKHLVVTFLVSLLIFLGSFPTLDSFLHHAPVAAEDFQPLCQSVEFDTPVAQNYQNLHDISCLDIFQPGLMQNLRTGFEKPLNLRAKTGLLATQRAGIGTNLPHRRIVQIAFEMPPESDNSRVVDVFQWSDLFVSCMSSASAVEGQDSESSHFFSRRFQMVQYISDEIYRFIRIRISLSVINSKRKLHRQRARNTTRKRKNNMQKRKTKKTHFTPPVGPSSR
jgi:hypothetical protein